MAEQLAFLAGITERDRILRALEEDHALYLEILRSFAREIAVLTGTVCVDDIRRKAQVLGLPSPTDLKISEKIFGVSLSRCRDFEVVATVDSTRPERIARSGRNASLINVYRLRSRGEAA